MFAISIGFSMESMSVTLISPKILLIFTQCILGEIFSMLTSDLSECGLISIATPIGLFDVFFQEEKVMNALPLPIS